MTTFAQALARIEALLKDEYHMTDTETMELRRLLLSHPHDIVQLGRVAKQMRRHCIAYAEEAIDAFEAYDKLIKGDEG